MFISLSSYVKTPQNGKNVNRKNVLNFIPEFVAKGKWHTNIKCHEMLFRLIIVLNIYVQYINKNYT